MGKLDLPFSDPEGGYFVLVNMAKVKLPADYPFPDHVKDRPRDFKLSWFLIQEVGVAAIPPTEFYTDKNAHIGRGLVAICGLQRRRYFGESKGEIEGLEEVHRIIRTWNN